VSVNTPPGWLLTYDAWLFFRELPELFDLAKAYPDTPVIINHCGGIVRIASYADKRPEVFARWSRSMRELAQLPNVYVKLAGWGCGYPRQRDRVLPTRGNYLGRIPPSASIGTWLRYLRSTLCRAPV
jgi:predicted TIM-barrel fold metal-dependent hydrolase